MNIDNSNQTSAFVICLNEAKNIERCLRSLTWCDEIIVIDSGSTDNTLEICKKYGAKIFQRPWPGYVAQKKFGLESCSNEWVLNLDADEEVSEELKNEILIEINDPSNKNINGYQLSRVVWYMNKWWRKGGWYPEYRLRLCRKSETEWGGNDPHEHALVNGTTKKLRGELRHYTYDDLNDHIDRLNKFSSSAARTMFKKGKQASIINLLFNPILRFLKFYIFKKGFLEGFSGLIVALLEAYYVFLKYIKLWELNREQQISLKKNLEQS